jgi:hypothetical protein
MIEALKAEERQLMYDTVWADPTVHRYEWALMSYFSSKLNGETGWQPRLEALLGIRGQDWELSSYLGNIQLVTEYTKGSKFDPLFDSEPTRSIVVYCDHTLDSISVMEKLLIGDVEFTPSLTLGFRSPLYLRGDPWIDHLLISPITAH